MFYSREHIEAIKKYLSESPDFQYGPKLNVLRYQQRPDYVEYLVKDIGVVTTILRMRESLEDLKKEFELMRILSEEKLTPKPLYLEEDTSILGNPFLLLQYEDVQEFDLSRDFMKLSKALGKIHAISTHEGEYLEKKEPPVKRILESSERIMRDLLKAQELNHKELVFFEDFIRWIKEKPLPQLGEVGLVLGDLSFEDIKRQGEVYFYNLTEAHLDVPLVEICDFFSPITQYLNPGVIFTDKDVEDFFLLYSKDNGYKMSEDFKSFMPVILLYQWSELMLLRSKDVGEDLLRKIEELTDLDYMRALLKTYA